MTCEAGAWKKRIDMKKKIVLWANDENDKKILLALELLEKESKVNMYTFSQEIVTEAFHNLMMENWRVGKEVAFPDGHQLEVRELSVTDDIIPERIKVQRTDLINRAKAEWHFVVLSTKLYDLYNSELEEFKDRIDRLPSFDSGVWEEVKGFWSKISDQARERNLFRDHADKLRDETNVLFNKLKEFKTKANEELAEKSKAAVSGFNDRLSAVGQKVEKGMSLSPLFDELKKIQADFKDAELTRNDRSKLWKKIDGAFKLVKEKKYGKPSEIEGAGTQSRVERRHSGLMDAIAKMERSIQRDKSDIDFQNKRAGSSHGQLEAQLRQAKIMMIEERITSKQEKLNEMLSTKADLEKRIEKEKERALKNIEKKEIQKKKEELKKKIATEISENATALSEQEAVKLEKAAAALNKPVKKGKADKKTTTPAPVANTSTDSSEPTNDTQLQKESKLDQTITTAKETQAKTEAAVANTTPKTETKTAEVVSEITDDAAITKKAAPTKEEPASKSEVAEQAKQATAAASDTVDKAKEVVADSAAEITEKKAELVSEVAKKSGLIGAAIAIGSKAMDKVNDKLDDLGLDDKLDQAKEKASELKDKVEDKLDKVEDKIEDKVDEAREKTDDSDSLVDTVKKGGLLGAAIAMGSKAMDKVTETMEDLGVDDKLDQAKEKISDLKDKVEDKLDDSKEALEDKVDEAKEKTSGATDIKDTIKKGGLLGAAIAIGAKVADSVSDKIEDLTDKLDLDDKVEQAKEKIEALKDKVVDGDSKLTADTSVDEVADRVRKEAPLDESKLKLVTSNEEE